MKLLALLLLLFSGCAHAPLSTEGKVMPNAGVGNRPSSELRAVTGGAHPTNALSDSVWLRWTHPTRCRVPLPGGVPWRTICAPDSDRVDRIVAVRVTGRRASATWRDSSARMLADAASWRRNWPSVRSEADERVILLRVYADSLSWMLPGTRDSARVAGADCYGVSVANVAGWSCERLVAR